MPVPPNEELRQRGCWPQPNNCEAPLTGRAKSHAVTVDGEVRPSDTLPAAWITSPDDHAGASASLSRLLRQQKVATQMHADQPGCRRSRPHGRRVGREPISVQRAIRVHPSDLRAFAFPLFLLCRGRRGPRGWRRNAKSTFGAAMTLWCAPDRCAGAHRLAGKVPVRSGIIVAVLLSPGNFWRRPSSKSADHRIVSGNSPRIAVIRGVGSAELSMHPCRNNNTHHRSRGLDEGDKNFTNEVACRIGRVRPHQASDSFDPFRAEGAEHTSKLGLIGRERRVRRTRLLPLVPVTPSMVACA